jgi:beta-hydroxylase
MRKRDTNSIRYRISAKLGKSLIRVIEYFISKCVKNDIYIDPRSFLWTTSVEQAYREIKGEYLEFKASARKALDICKISEEQYHVISEDKWDFIPLFCYGQEITEFTSLFPATKKALLEIPDMTTAFFSILKPDTFIKEHRGAYKGYLRYQLGVVIPKPEKLCGILIHDVPYHWKEGESVIFDDTFLHSAWNKSNEERVVLYVDFIRPMKHPLRLVSWWLTVLINKSPFIQNALKNLREELKNHNPVNQ